MKKLGILSAPILFSASLVAGIMLQARPGLASCCMFLDTYGVYGRVCNYWELCSNQRSNPSLSSGTTVKTRNGEVVFPTGYGIPEISTPDGKPLNVHAGPSFDTPVVGTVANGSALALTGHIENNDWFETMDGYFIYKHHAR